MIDERKLKITVGINTLTEIQYPAYCNHIQFFYRLGRSYPNVDTFLFTPNRMSIDRMRNACAKIALESESDYLLFIDDDVLIPTDGLKKLLDLDADIAAGNVLIRGYPFDCMYFRYTDKTKQQLKPLKERPIVGPISVDAVGFSFCLIKVSLLKKTPPPFFITGPTNTEDIYFCLKTKLAVPDCCIMVDTSVECAHILGPELISSTNKDFYKNYCELLNPLLLSSGNQSDRGESYVKEVKAATKT